MLLIDKYAYFNRLKHIHPVEKMTFALFLLLFALTVKDTIVSLITFAVMSAFIILGAKIPLRYYIKLLLLPGFFLLSGILTIVISFASIKTTTPHVLWSVEFGYWKLFITENNIKIATKLILVVLSSISCLYFLTLTTPVNAILQVLRKLKVPQLLIEIIEITYRFIFVFLETALHIYQAQNSRLGYMTMKKWLHSLGLLISSLFINVFKRAKELTIAMDSRGYTEDIMYIDDNYQYSAVNWIIITIIIASIVAVYLLFGGTL
ncbi:cobalt ECF transporter T component CbiQ [Peribacillus asahii]|uniref:Cobalt ECF transporter T component CbiQ n=1 Tax=Peribacillus asahii TaxID=228899 RepID=A0A398BCA7_9BACI|nr:cobalt ECF transporter T component CbiQ [Peribacillus asahii]RID87447.1 cobalt ECF transporter T component CbiQ [Peribacillus asahii]